MIKLDLNPIFHKWIKIGYDLMFLLTFFRIKIILYLIKFGTFVQLWNKVWVKPQGGFQGFSDCSLGWSMKTPKRFSEGKPEAVGRRFA